MATIAIDDNDANSMPPVPVEPAPVPIDDSVEPDIVLPSRVVEMPTSPPAARPPVPPPPTAVDGAPQMSLPTSAAVPSSSTECSTSGGGESADAPLSSADSESDLAPAVHDVVLRPQASQASQAPPTAPAALAGRDGPPAAVGRTGANLALPAVVDALGTVTSLEGLSSLLTSEAVRSIGGANSEAVGRCVQYVRGLARDEETVLCGWPVLSINEWGAQQVRTLVLTSHALYRIAFQMQRGAIDHYSRTSLGSLRRIERGRFAFKLLLTEPDGRENPLTYFWTSYVKKGNQGDHRYERVYYPIHTEALPVELVLACMINALDVANRLLHARVGQFMYVSRLAVANYQPNTNAIDEFMDKLAPALQRMGDKLGDGLAKLIDRPGGGGGRGGGSARQ